MSQPQSELPAPQSPHPNSPPPAPRTPQWGGASGSAGLMPDHPSPPSSAGSNKRVAEDDISELVRKAKASRYNQTARKNDDDDIADTLERDLSCAICSEVLTNPVACLDCLHNFCGSCLVPWFERSNTCPTCRQAVKGTRDNHSTASLIETLLNRFPDKKRDADELKELEAIYKPGQKINITNSYDEDDDEQDQEDEDEEDEHITWTPCPCCTPNDLGFTCPDPIPAPNPLTGPQIADVYSYRSHLRCQTCPNTFPTAWKPGWKCENCSVLYCGNLFECERKDWVKRVSEQSRNLNSYIYVSGFAAFRGNSTELANFTRWREANNLTWVDIGEKVYNYLLRKHGDAIPATNRLVRSTDYVCQNCVTGPVQNNFLNWWCAEKESEGYTDARSKCWYGKACRTQFHNLEHAAKLSHACDEVPVHERRNTAPRGGPARARGIGDGVGAADGDGGVSGASAGAARGAAPVPAADGNVDDAGNAVDDW